MIMHEFDSSTIAADHASAEYLAAIDRVLDTVFLDKPIHARLRAFHLGPVRLIALDASPRRSTRTPALIASDHYDGISVQLVVSGHAAGDAAGRPVASAPGTIMILDFAQPFTIVDQEPRSVINAAIPRAMLTPRLGDVGALHGQVLRPEQGGLLAAYLRELPPRLATLPMSAAPVLHDIIVELLLLALGHDGAGPQAPPPPGRRAALLDRATHLVDSRLGATDLSAQWLIDRLSVSRSELYAAFGDAGGISRFIWRRRLEAARAALADPHDRRRIGEIAFAYGFSSEAHFSRSFKATFGKTATEIRLGAQQPVP